eukprot:m.140491 g.140491  ORF g.140491 m.140491 type:complete len:971 (-) comp30121_c0_seq1:127-3039(-)
MATMTSAAPILALLDETDTELLEFALEKLNSVVDQFWAEIGDFIYKIEIIYENEDFKQRGLAALVASKVYYHLGALDEAMTFALAAGTHFDVGLHSEYVHTIIGRCIDTYSESQQATAGDVEMRDDATSLLSVVERMFERCFSSNEYKQAAGIAFETRRLDILKRAIEESGNIDNMLDYCFRVCQTLIASRTFRLQILALLAQLYATLPKPGYLRLCQCYIYLGDVSAVASMLKTLISGDDEPMAYQVAFDLYDSATQQFLAQVREMLKPTVGETEAVDGVDGASASAQVEDPSSVLEKILAVLSGEYTLKLTVEFLSRNNNADKLLMTKVKDAAGRSSISHNASVIANSVMYAGTTSATFLSENMDWLKIANNWAKFNAVASLGVIYKGHTSEAMKVLEHYLPGQNSSGGVYVEAGGLYALGLIYANHGEQVTQYFLTHLSGNTTEVTQHGGCLGLGLASMGSAKTDVYTALRDILFRDGAVAGEAAALSMGLVMLGSGDETALDEMIQYARETTHEKIIRGLGMGTALVMYGRQNQADKLINALQDDKDAILRMAAVNMIATAYVGTGENLIMKKLLHIAVSDVSDDVRRCAVTAMGFVLCRTPDQLPSTVMLLCESFNPHVRYGSCMALGIAFCGTGNIEALSLLEPLLKDSIGYVRQGAMLALALIMMQQPSTHPNFKSTQAQFAKVMEDKHEDILSKFGAIYAQGIVAAGGQNVTCNLVNNQGHVRMQAVVGMLVFTQFWFWFPFGHFLSLAMTPTAVICLNKDLKMPKIELKSNASPDKFAYPPATEPPKEKSKDKVETAVLSTTAKSNVAKKGDNKKDDTKNDDKDAMDIDDDAAKKTEAKTETPDADKTKSKDDDATAATKDDVETSDSPPKPKATFSMLANPARVVAQQFKVLELPAEGRYRAVRGGDLQFVTILTDSKPDEEEELLELQVTAESSSGPATKDDDEADPPEPFVFNEELEK